MRIHDEIKPRSADEIESGQIVSCSGNAGNGDVITTKGPETIQQHLRWTRTPRRVHKALARPGFVGLGDQLEPGFLRKGAQFDPAIGMADQAGLQPLESRRDGRVGESGLFSEFLGGQGAGLPEPVDEEDPKDVEKGFRRSAHRPKSTLARTFADGLDAAFLDVGQFSDDPIPGAFSPDDECDPVENLRTEQGLGVAPFLLESIIANLRFVQNQNAVKPAVHEQDLSKPHERRTEMTKIPQIGQDLKDAVPDQCINTETKAVP